MKLNNLYPNTVKQIWIDIAKQLIDHIEFFNINKNDYWLNDKITILELLNELLEVKNYYMEYWNMYEEINNINNIEWIVKNFLNKNNI